MRRKWFYYMLGRLICGDDCLAQVFRKRKATKNYRYQIQAKEYNEGILWGRICARAVFKTNKYYSYQKKNHDTYNTVIKLQNKEICSLFDDEYVSPRTYSERFKESTALAVIKNIPLKKLLEFQDQQIAEFLAGCFDSDGSIRPDRSIMSIYLDTQTSNRSTPLAYDQIKLFKHWSKANKMPDILGIRIDHPPGLFRSKARLFRKNIKKLLPNVKLMETNRKGVRVEMCFSCNARMRSRNRTSLEFWIKNVVPRFIRDDKKAKFLKFYEERKHLFSPIGTRNVKGFGITLAKHINRRSNIIMKRPKYPQCEVRIILKSLNNANSLKKKIERNIDCKARVYRKHNKFFVTFYVSSKNFPEIERFVLPFVKRGKKRLHRIINILKNKNKRREGFSS